MTKHMPISPQVKAIYDYVQKMRLVEAKSSREWRDQVNRDMANYRAGMVSVCLYIAEFIERHP